MSIADVLNIEKNAIIRSYLKNLRAKLPKKSEFFGNYVSDTVASGRLFNTITGVVSGNETNANLKIFGTDYWRFANYGRRPGSQPPSLAILAWMDARGIAKNDNNQKRLAIAFLIARKIKREGTNREFSFFASRETDSIRDRLQKSLSENLKKQIIKEIKIR